MEQHYAFIKENRLVQISVFAEPNQDLADQIATEQGFDQAIWVGETIPHLHSEFYGEKFIDPTDEYLISIGVIQPIIETPTIEETPAK